MTVYADNAATTPMSEAAVAAMLPYLTEISGNPSSLHSDGQRAKEALEAARADVAAALGAQPREILFTSGGSEADNTALRAAAVLGAEKGKRHLVSTAIEHHAVLHTLAALEKEGFEVTLVPVGESGIVDPAAVAAAIREDNIIIALVLIVAMQIPVARLVVDLHVAHPERLPYPDLRIEEVGTCVAIVQSRIDYLDSHAVARHQFPQREELVLPHIMQ